MAQHDQVIDNGPGLTVRTDINAAFAAIFSCSSGPVEPAVKVAGQLWFDTSTNPPTTRQRNGANTAWVSLSGLSNDGLTLFLKEGTTTRGTVGAGGSPGDTTGTLALRCFNSAGAQTGLFYVSSADIGTDRNTISVFNANDQALWFRATGGVIRGGLYNYTSGRTELRAYNGGALKNLVGIDENISGFTYALVWTYNSNAAAGDVWISHRVSGTRAMRWYYAQSGDIFLQESDDNYGSHFINVFAYSRGNNVLSVSNLFQGNGLLLNGSGGSNNGLFNGTGDGASFSTYNVMLRSWWGIGFPSATDGVCRISFDCRSGRIHAQETYIYGNMYMNSGTRYQQDGNIIFTSGMTVYGGSLYDAIGTVWNGKAGIYTGDWQDETNFPLGHTIIARGGSAIARNAAGTIRLGTANNAEYRYNSGTGTVLAGTWRHRGYFDDAEGGTGGGLYERTA